MDECEECGLVEELTRQCSYCEAKHCSPHMLPENHDCPGIIMRAVGRQWLWLED